MFYDDTPTEADVNLDGGAEETEKDTEGTEETAE